jgi:hypothetical protein
MRKPLFFREENCDGDLVTAEAFDMVVLDQAILID